MVRTSQSRLSGRCISEAIVSKTKALLLTTQKKKKMNNNERDENFENMIIIWCFRDNANEKKNSKRKDIKN